MSVSSPHFLDKKTFFPILYKKFEDLENCLDKLGYIPVVGTISASLIREPLAITQLITGLAIGFFSFISSSHSSLNHSVAITLIVNGTANELRSKIEMVPFLPLITLLPMDLLHGRVISYPNLPLI